MTNWQEDLNTKNIYVKIVVIKLLHGFTEKVNKLLNGISIKTSVKNFIYLLLFYNILMEEKVSLIPWK